MNHSPWRITLTNAYISSEMFILIILTLYFSEVSKFTIRRISENALSLAKTNCRFDPANIQTFSDMTKK